MAKKERGDGRERVFMAPKKEESGGKWCRRANMPPKKEKVQGKWSSPPEK
ncbi:hypothetical protein [Cytobacillus firmus]|nr:hypothetical protein [Cytobacillus firmus]